MNEGYFVSEDANVYYRKMGSGEMIVLLHGNRQSHRSLMKIARILSKKYQVVLMDSRGHGNSQFGKRRLSLDLMVEDLYLLLEEIGVRRVILFGFSDGANLAIHFAASYPNRVSRVIAVSSNVRAEGLKPLFLSGLKASMVVFRFFGKLHIPTGRQMALTDLMLRYSDISDQELSQITAPVLILSGDNDIVRKKHSLEMGHLIKNAEVKIIKGAGHLTMFSKTEMYMAIISGFLGVQLYEKT
ncbi:MAG: alpha/beta hydrolase [Lachnospiraceae bacterium]|nr:alpha/beta hydrolase [Lachnospiraceae bacterium]